MALFNFMEEDYIKSFKDEYKKDLEISPAYCEIIFDTAKGPIKLNSRDKQENQNNMILIIGNIEYYFDSCDDIIFIQKISLHRNSGSKHYQLALNFNISETLSLQYIDVIFNNISLKFMLIRNEDKYYKYRDENLEDKINILANKVDSEIAELKNKIAELESQISALKANKF
jgi:hypothetical protein